MQGDMYAYAVAGNGAGLYDVELADPKKPVVRNVYYSGSYVNEIVVAGTHTCVSGNVLHILDITDRVVPVNVCTHSLTQNAPGEWVADVVTGRPQGRTHA